MDRFDPQQASQPTSLKRDRSDDEDHGAPAKRLLADESDVTLGNPYMDDNANVSEKYPIPETAVGIVIGRGGAEIQGIQNKSGCRVQMSQESTETGVRNVNLEGPRANVEAAKVLISEVVSRAQTGRSAQGVPRSQSTVEVPIPPNRCGLIIGKAGETIRQLQEQSGCKIVLIQESQAVSDLAKPLRITGEPHQIEHAKQLVSKVLAGGENLSGGGGGGYQMHHGGGGGATARGEVVVPRSSVGIIIGKQGETIKRLAMETNTKIQFKPDDDPKTAERCAVITGTREQIYRATERITELVRKSTMQQGGGGNSGMMMMNNDSQPFYMSVPAAKCGLVIGKGGETIKQINSESGAHCELSREHAVSAEEKVFIIKGGKREIEHAKHLIRIKVGDIPPNTPFRDDAMLSMQSQYSAQQQGGYGSQQAWSGPTAMAAASQNPYQVGGWQQANAYGQQQGVAASAAAPYAGMVAAPAQATYQTQQQVLQQSHQAQIATANANSTVDPVTGEQDYSAQWMEYYKSIGAHDKAEAVEAQMKKKKADAAARAAGSVSTGLIQPIQMGMAQIGGQATIPAQTYPAYTAGSVSAAYQPQQYGQYQ